MKLTSLLATLLGVGSASNLPPAPPPLPLKLSKQAFATEEMDFEKKQKFEDLVAGPLHSASDLVSDKVDTYLQRIADVVTEKDAATSSKEMLEMATDIRKLLDKVVPKLLWARDNSSAVERDNRPSNASQATIAQDVLLKLETYSSWAWPVIIGYARDAYDEKTLTDDIKARMQRGTDGSLSYLSSVLLYAWQAAKFQFPVVEGMMARKDSNGEILVKAGCAASYAQLLGDMTQMYSDLSDSKLECFLKDGNLTDWQKCAADAAHSLYKVNMAIAEASNAMWQCFGIYWGCSQLVNQAYADLAKALGASLDMSKTCGGEDAELCKSYAFKVLGTLSQGAGLMESATDDCSLKGASGNSALNPWAATPFEQRKDVETTQAKV
mmetsp:Transcript_68663/g.163541  ORF Transcript_68663/g.163541 Transcript_68663/m.163541 type:complete len:381 (+) Transcript_68663:63-1205(+)